MPLLAVDFLNGLAKPGKGASVAEVVAAAERATGRRIARIAAPRRAEHPARLVAEPGSFSKTLGWQTERSNLEIVIADAWYWYQQ